MLTRWAIREIVATLAVMWLCLFSVQGLLAQTVTFNPIAPPAATTLTTGSTYNVPTGVTYLMVETWGGGGSGGRRSTNGYGAGGGGGAYSMSIIQVTQSTYRYGIGAGSSSSTGATPNHGGDTWFNTVNSASGALVLAQGGRGVANNGTTGAVGGSAASGIGQITLSGGNGSNQVTSGTTGGGGGGSSAGNLLGGVNASGRAGATAPSGGGNGGNGRLGSDGQGVGIGGSTPGGGGGGAYRTSNNSYDGGAGASGQIIVTPLQSTSTWTVPAGVTSIKIEAWGGGGRGGSFTTSSSGNRGGGGGGAYASSIISVTPGQTYYIAAGTGSNNNGNPGEDSWVSLNAYGSSPGVLAKGGSSAAVNNSTGANGGDYAASIGSNRNNGGRGADGSGSGSGGGGSSAGSSGTGVNATNQFGAVAPLGVDGNGGNGGASGGNNAGLAGSAPGGGGGGAFRNTNGTTNGGNGANGRVIITVLGPTSPTNTAGLTEWVAPAGVTAIEVETWGAGGSGGNHTTQTGGRGGGGGGGYSRRVVSVTPGTTYYINVGAGSTSTSAGDDSWFSTTNVTGGSLVRAKGGSSNQNNTTGAAGGVSSGGTNPPIGDVGGMYAGGNGGLGVTGTRSGGGGSSAGHSANGNNGNNANTNGGAAPPGGGAGANGRTDNGNGSTGSPPGGGGSGAYRATSGTTVRGAGADGQVIIHTFYNLSIIKTVNKTTPLVGEAVTFTLAVTNNGTNTARGIGVLDVIQSGFTSTGTGTPTHGTVDVPTSTWNIPALEPSTTATLTFTATVNASGNYTNTATLTANLPNKGNSSSTITLFPKQPTTNLQLNKEVDNAMSLIGEEVEFKLTVYNAGPQNATGVKVVDILSFGFSHVSHLGDGTYDAGTGIWTIGNLNSGATATLNLTAIVNPSGNHYNQAIVTGNEIDPVLSNNSSGIQVYPMYPLIEIVLPMTITTYDLTGLTIGTPPPGAQISWHSSSPASDANKILTPTQVKPGDIYYVAYFDPDQVCYGSTSEVRVTWSGLITNPMIRQQVKRE